MEFGIFAKGLEEHLFYYGGPRRTATATSFCPRRATKGREGPRRTATATSFCPRRAAKGHEGPRRTATATSASFCPRRAAKGHEGPRRTATATSASFCPRRAAKGHEERLRQLLFVRGGAGGTPFVVEADCGRRTRGLGAKRTGSACRVLMPPAAYSAAPTASTRSSELRSSPSSTR